MILGEVGPRKPDVGDQPVRRLGGDEHAVALGLLQVVDVGRPRHAAGKILLRVEGRGRLKGIFGIDHVHVARLKPTGHQHVEGKELTRGILGQSQFLARQITNRFDPLTDDDAVAAVGEVHLLKHPRHHAGVLRRAGAIDEPLQKQRDHVERGPADVHLAGGVGITHRHGVVDEHEFDLERLAARRLPDLSGLEAVVGEDDRTPAGPDIQREADRVILEWFVGTGALHRRQFLGRLERVFLDRSRHCGITSLEEHPLTTGATASRSTPGLSRPIAGADRSTGRRPRLPGRGVAATTGRPPQAKLVEHPGPPGSERHETENDGPDSEPERSLGLASHQTPPRVQCTETKQ